MLTCLHLIDDNGDVLWKHKLGANMDSVAIARGQGEGKRLRGALLRPLLKSNKRPPAVYYHYGQPHPAGQLGSTDCWLIEFKCKNLRSDCYKENLGDHYGGPCYP